jgi:hypothetical protein
MFSEGARAPAGPPAGLQEFGDRKRMAQVRPFFPMSRWMGP